MKKLITMAAIALAGVAQAGDYHEGDELKCQQCHTMHASRAHGFEINSTTGVLATSTTVFTPMDNLLVGADTNETCLSCHDKNKAGGYDVFGPDYAITGASTSTSVRGGGGLNGTVGTHVATAAQMYAPGTGHTLGYTGAVPGSAASITNFSCADCHAVHGNTAYRNLGDSAKGFTAAQQPTYATTTTVVTNDFDVVEEEPAAYDTNLVKFGSGGGAFRMNEYCAKCHGDFHGATNVNGSAGNFKRHPTGTETFGVAETLGGVARYTATDIVRPVVASADGQTLSPGCLTCHKGHGNMRAFGLLHPGAATNTNREEGDQVGVIDHTGTRLFYNPKVLCTVCHIQGK